MIFSILCIIVAGAFCVYSLVFEFAPWPLSIKYILKHILGIIGSFLLGAFAGLLIMALWSGIGSTIFWHANRTAAEVRTYDMVTLPGTEGYYIANADKSDEHCYYVVLDNEKSMTMQCKYTTLQNGSTPQITETIYNFKNPILRFLFIPILPSTYVIEAPNINIDYNYMVNNISE